MSLYNTKCLILWLPWDSRLGYLYPGFPDYWFAPSARPHLNVPGVTGGQGSVFKAHSSQHPNKWLNMTHYFSVCFVLGMGNSYLATESKHNINMHKNSRILAILQNSQIEQPNFSVKSKHINVTERSRRY